MSFNIDDRVLVKSSYYYTPVKGLEGVVVVANEYDSLVDFGEAWRDSYSDTSKLWIDNNDLEIAPVRPFFLIKIENGQEVHLKDHPTFDSGKDAAAYAVRLSSKLGVKVQPRRLTDIKDDWRAREEKRLADGTYQKLPEAWDLEPIKDHFLHLAAGDATMLAFTETEEKGALDRQTRLNPGRYLQRFYPQLDQETMKRYIAMIDNTCVLQFAVTADEIEWVYENGPDSCMSGPYNAASDRDDDDDDYDDDDDTKYFEGHCHPVRVYGDSDLQVAYFAKGDNVTARAVVWPEKKQYVRTYGDIARLKAALEFEGYTQVDEFVGCRVRRIKDQNHTNRLIMPYLDGDCSTVKESECGEWLIFAHGGPINCSSTEGIAYPPRRCEKTDVVITPHEGSTTVIVAINPRRTQRWCMSAVRQHAIEHYYVPENHRYGRTEYFDKAICTAIGDPAHGRYIPTHLLGNDYVQCAVSGFTYEASSMVTLADGRKVNTNVFRRAGGFTCAGTGKRYLGDQAVDVNGETYSQAYVTKRAEYNARRRERRRLAKLAEPQAAAA